jgi:hypothetical protein
LAGAARTTVGGAITEIVTGFEVAAAPVLSVAVAVKVYLPTARPVTASVYGAAVAWPRLVLPSKNWTLAIVPLHAVASATSLTLPGAVTDEPLAGEVSVTPGGSWAFTVTYTGYDVALTPNPSVATAVSL